MDKLQRNCDANRRQESSTCNETTSLIMPGGFSSNHHHHACQSYDATTHEMPLDTIDNEVPHFGQGTNSHHWRGPTAFLFLAATVVVLMMVELIGSHGTFSRLWPSSQLPPLSDLDPVDSPVSLIGGGSTPSVADGDDDALSTTTFGELALAMLLDFYNNMLPAVKNTLTSRVKPGAVYKTRKIILKTRDLLDVFAPVYPNRTGGKDLWQLLRFYLDHGYEIVGNFLDLNHTHVRYTQHQADLARNEILAWKKDFASFRQKHDIPPFLASPSMDVSFLHEKESRLFWKDGTKRPKASDLATTGLHMLGSKQLNSAMHYLRKSFHHKHGINDKVHEAYHSLRKTLRSLCDEYELFGSFMFPPSTASAVKVLQRARKLLGDMNDDWTALEFYIAHDEFPKEQERLAQKVNHAWKNFKLWALESNLQGSLQYLAECMNSTLALSEESNDNRSIFVSVDLFLHERRQNPTRHFVIGNKAGDADSIVSAITLAYVESIAGVAHKTPIVSIPRADLETKRPETRFLLKLAGVSMEHLLFVDDDIIENDAYGVNVTLVDQNSLDGSLQAKNWTVLEIVDHHRDEGRYLDTCSGVARNIAFANDQALVASANTLVAERLKELWKAPSYPASLGLLLLGVILLDSVNLSQQVGKVTQRDRDAVQVLLDNTRWQDLTEESRKVLQVTSTSAPNTTAFFDALQDAKYDPSFWASISVRDALQLDYKAYDSFGVSTVLMPLQDFLSQTDLIPGIQQYMDEVDVNFLGIMLAFEEHGYLRRQLVLCSTDKLLLDKMVKYLFAKNPLQLQEIHRSESLGLYLRAFNQRHVESSRKQIAPILHHFFSTTETVV